MNRIGFLCLIASFCFTGCTTTPADTKDTVSEQTEHQVVSLSKAVASAPVTEPTLSEANIEMLAKLVWGEARGCTTTEQAAVIWCVLNRVDSEDPVFPDTIEEVVTQPWQFIGYDPGHPVEQDKVALAEDVLNRWLNGEEGRVLPEEYVFFHGDGVHNHFRTEYEHNGLYWDWSLDSPYEGEVVVLTAGGSK